MNLRLRQFVAKVGMNVALGNLQVIHSLRIWEVGHLDPRKM